MNNIKEVFFDLETQMWSSEVEGGFSNIPAFGMSLAVTWDDDNDFRVWLEKDVEFDIYKDCYSAFKMKTLQENQNHKSE